jgi:hypothetical protein
MPSTEARSSFLNPALFLKVHACPRMCLTVHFDGARGI